MPKSGAGGPQAQPSDYYYGAMKFRNYVEGGHWGIFRVHPNGSDASIIRLPDRS